VHGNLDAPAISMEEGAQLNGSVRMGGAAGAKSHSTIKASPEAASGGNAQKQDNKTEMAAKGSSS
jgi:cytoskeletal protein CcmA (bactofilin family)